MKKSYIVLFFLLVLTGCSKPIPADKVSYIGQWESEHMYLLIDADGSINYERETLNGSSSINASIQEFVGDDFVVGFGFLNTTFEVDVPPYEYGGNWYLQVDGEELIRTK